MKHDALKLRLIRESMGMTQEKLAILSNVSERTVQRAEAGANMRLDTLSDFAAALEVPLSELAVEADDLTFQNEVSLRRIRSGRNLIDELAKAGIAAFDCEVDPRTDELADILAIVRLVEQLLPNPWEMDQRPAAAGLATKIELAAQFSEMLAKMESLGVGLYVSASWISARYPRYDIDEGFMCTSGRQRYERVPTLQLILARTLEDKVYRKPASSWGLDTEIPPALPATFDTDLDDDVPF